MTEEKTGRFTGRGAYFAAFGVIVVVLPLGLVSVAGVISYFLLASIIGLALLVGVIFSKGRRLAVLLILLAFCAVSFGLVKDYDAVRPTVRWFLWSGTFKARVLAQRDRGDGEWKHLEWDGWGFAGAGNTTVYVVFDPHNSLAAAAENGSPGVVFTPDPVLVPRVRRLEESWYSVVFYTETDWRNPAR